MKEKLQKPVDLCNRFIFIQREQLVKAIHFTDNSRKVCRLSNVKNPVKNVKKSPNIILKTNKNRKVIHFTIIFSSK